MALSVAVTLLSELWLHVPGPSTNRELCEELEQRGHRVTLITSPRDISEQFDCLIPRWIFEGSSLPPAASASLALEQQGSQPVNSTSAMLRSTDKLLSKQLFSATGLPVPVLYDGAPGDWICKPRVGSMGGNIVTGSDPLLIDRLLLDAPEPYLVEKQIPAARMWRVICSSSKTLGSYSWLPQAGSFSALGADYDFQPASLLVTEFAQAMVSAVGGDIMGCDILEDPQGNLYAIEINGSFGLIPFEGSLTSAWVDQIEELCS